MSQLAVTVIGTDRPGIVAAVTEVLADLGANLADTSSTILRGHFTMTLIVDRAGSPAEVAAALAPVAERLELVVAVREVPADPPAGAGGAPHVLSLHGADRPGIVARVSGLVAGVGGNVTDLTTRLAGPLYVLVMELDLPTGADAAALQADLRRLATELGVDAHLRAADADVL